MSRRWNRWDNRWNDYSYFGLQQQQPALLATPVAAPQYLAQSSAQPLMQPQFVVPGQMVGPNVYASTALATPGAVCRPAPTFVVAPLGFRSRKVGGHMTRRIIARSREGAYQPSGLFIPHHVARHFSIKSIRVSGGGGNLLSRRGSVPAEFFSRENCDGMMIQLPVLLPGQRVVIRVRNHTGSSHNFRAALTGRYIY